MHVIATSGRRDRGTCAGPASAFLVAVVAIALLVPPAAAQVGSGERRVGDDEDATVASVLISTDAFADGVAQAAYIATAATFADALAGAALAGTRGPVLFNDDAEGGARAELLEEIQRAVGPAQGCAAAGPLGYEVALLGGEVAISAAAQAQIEALGYCVARFAGLGREQTAIEITRELMGDATTISRLLLARRDNVADAATGGAYAAISGTPLVVTPPTILHPDLDAFLREVVVEEVVILGGPAAISEEVAAQVDALVGTVTRVAGASRDATAVAIAETLWPDAIDAAGLDTAVLVNGFSDRAFVYSLAAGPLSALEGAPQLYTQRDALPEVTIAYLAAIEGGTLAGALGGGRGIAQILSGPSSEIAFDPGGGFDNLSDLPPLAFLAESVDGAGQASVTYTDDVRAGAADAGSFSTVLTAGSAPSWHPDHTRAYAVRSTLAGDEVVELRPEAGTDRSIFGAAGGVRLSNPVASPDGTKLAFDSTSADGELSVTVLDLTSEEPSVIREGLNLETIIEAGLASHQPWLHTSDGLVLANAQANLIGITTDFERNATRRFEGTRAAASPVADLIAVDNRAPGALRVDLFRANGFAAGSVELHTLATPTFSGDGTTLVLSEFSTGDALTCPAEVSDLADCTRFAVAGGFGGAVTTTPAADVLTGISRDGTEVVLIDLRVDEPDVSVIDGLGETVAAPRLRSYCPTADAPAAVQGAHPGCP